MTYVYNNRGTCSVRTEVELNPDHTIAEVRVLGGCNGNLKGIAGLLRGMKAEDAQKAPPAPGTAGPEPAPAAQENRHSGRVHHQ